MKHLKKFNESIKFEGTDDEIIEFFMDYHDDDNIEIENYILKDGKVIRPIDYFPGDKSKYKKIKIVKIRLDVDNGVDIFGKKTLNDINLVRNILDELERFYKITGIDINYTINTDSVWTEEHKLSSGIFIKFIVDLGGIPIEMDKTDIIDELFQELNIIYKKMKYRPNIKGDIFILNVAGRRKKSRFGDYSIELNELWGNIERGDNIDNEYSELIEWYQKVINNGLKIEKIVDNHKFALKLESNR